MLDTLIPALLIVGGLVYFGLLAAGLLADWHLPYPASYWWLAVTGCPALGFALMHWRSRPDPSALEGEEK